MPLPWKDGVRYIAGGSFIGAPVNAFGVKLAPEVSVVGDIELEITDFGVPKNKAVFLEALRSTMEILNKNEPVYVGCFAGIGRTGMFLGSLARALGVDDPLRYVRTYYNKRAIETQEQYDFMMSLDLRELNAKFGAAKIDEYKCNDMGKAKSVLELCKELPKQWEGVLEEFGFIRLSAYSNEYEDITAIPQRYDYYLEQDLSSDMGTKQETKSEQTQSEGAIANEKNEAASVQDQSEPTTLREYQKYVVGVQKRRI